MPGRRKPSQRSDQPLRLPLDVLVAGDGRGVPDLQPFGQSVEEYLHMRAVALSSDSFSNRVLACWGLIARGEKSLEWCRRALTSKSIEDVEDGAGVAGHVGTPGEWIPFLEDLVSEASDEMADVLTVLIPAERALQSVGENAIDEHDASSGVLLQSNFDPFTEIIYFVNAGYEAVVDSQRQWRSNSPNARAARWSEAQGSLESLLELLEPFSRPSHKSLWVETASNWTAVFSQGSDLSYVAHFAKLLNTRVIRTASSPHVVRDGNVVRYGGTSIWIWDPDGQGGYRQTRTLQASRQGSRWQWDVGGSPLPFEDTAAYERRIVRERFDIHGLNVYCQQLGVQREDASSYGPRATLEELDTSNFQELRTMSSADWRAAHS